MKASKPMNASQKGFTLVEIAIVLVIIGLLLGGVLKGQELINSAKVKNLANDFRNVPVYIYGYQDKFKRLPGDDSGAVANISAPAGHVGDGDGVLEGAWDSTTAADESVRFWEHIRLANLAPGSTDFSDDTAAAASVPANAEGGRVGVSGTKPISNMNGGSFYMCSGGIEGKLARQVDLTMDDGSSNTGSMQAMAAGTNTVAASYVDGTKYAACMTY